MTDLEQARQLLEEDGYACVLCGGGMVHTSRQTGIRPMVEFLTRGTDLRGCSAADKIVGRAAALLFALAGVTAVHGQVMSRGARQELEARGIRASWDILADEIINRAGTGRCPMEQAVEGISDPVLALKAVRRTLEELKRGAQAVSG